MKDTVFWDFPMKYLRAFTRLHSITYQKIVSCMQLFLGFAEEQIFQQYWIFLYLTSLSCLNYLMRTVTNGIKVHDETVTDVDFGNTLCIQTNI
jgi:hypothetical protein